MKNEPMSTEAVSQVVANQERLVRSIATGLLNISTPETEVFQTALGAYLLIEATRIQFGLVTGSVADVADLAERSTYTLLRELGAHLEDDMSSELN